MVAWIFAAGLSARDASAAQAPVFKEGVDAVVAAVSVRDGRGRLVRDLKKEDFEVIDSGFGRPIREFYAGQGPVSLAVLLDISGSMAIGGNIDRARHAVAMAMTHLRQEGDEAALFTFDSGLQQVVGFTTDLERVRRVSLEGSPWGETSMFDAIGETARVASTRSNRHRAVLVITDGVDTHSRLTAAEVTTIARAIEVPVYLLTVSPLREPKDDRTIISVDGRSVDATTLHDLAIWTGGDMRVVSAIEHTQTEINDLFSELRAQYIIVFEPGPRPGWHPLEIRTPGRNLVVHARSGYMTVPPQS
jgi:Ca-activated chloride channel family protein